MNSGGDVLARGGASAQFAGAGSAISQFQDDVIFRPEIVIEKYGITEEELKKYQTAYDLGEKLPDLPTAELKKDKESKELFTITDRRLQFQESLPQPVAVTEPPKFSEKEFGSVQTVLDRVIVKRVSADKDFELLDDGSLRNKKTKMVIPAKYRQHSNTGIVLVAGQFAVLGGLRIPMADIVRPGDRVTFGDYNSEVYHMAEDKIRQLCDAVQLNYEEDPEGLRVVRVQDIRTFESPLEGAN